MPPVNSQQFSSMAGELKDPDGGFSVRLPTGQSAPPHGYMVAQAGTEKKHGPGVDVTGQHLKHYARVHAGLLARRGRYMGGWHDPDTHDKDLDVSRRYESRDRALASMWHNDQDALYRLKPEEGAPYGRSERNFAKLGTEPGKGLGKYLDEKPMPPGEYAELRRGAARRAR